MNTMEFGLGSFIHNSGIPSSILKSLGQFDTYEKELQVPKWMLVATTVLLSLAFIVGLPVNGATILIFWKRKKLRHLVNFILLLDCFSHILLILICIPIYLTAAWSNSVLIFNQNDKLIILQKMIANFVNIFSTLLTVSIAILRYRRLCCKKKDKFSAKNAFNWSISSTAVAVGITAPQVYMTAHHEMKDASYYLSMVKLGLISLSLVIISFCYIRVSQKVWTNAANHETLMDPIKLKKSRKVHFKATIHSCIQILLIIFTLSPHMYEQAVDSVRVRNKTDGAGNSLLSSPTKSSASQQNAEDHPFQSKFFTEEDITMPASAESMWIQNHVTSLIIAVTINYTLICLGTPIAYIFSCHRFREQFINLIFGHVGKMYAERRGKSSSRSNPHKNSGESKQTACHTNSNGHTSLFFTPRANHKRTSRKSIKRLSSRAFTKFGHSKSSAQTGCTSSTTTGTGSQKHNKGIPPTNKFSKNVNWKSNHTNPNHISNGINQTAKPILAIVLHNRRNTLGGSPRCHTQAKKFSSKRKVSLPSISGDSTTAQKFLTNPSPQKNIYENNKVNDTCSILTSSKLSNIYDASAPKHEIEFIQPLNQQEEYYVVDEMNANPTIKSRINSSRSLQEFHSESNATEHSISSQDSFICKRNNSNNAFEWSSTSSLEDDVCQNDNTNHGSRINGFGRLNSSDAIRCIYDESDVSYQILSKSYHRPTQFGSYV